MAIITATLISTILGAVTGVLPDVVDLFKKRQDSKHELELTKLKAHLQKQNAGLELDKLNAKADIAEGKSILAHDAGLDGGSVINALRASVRPVITYLFFFAWSAIKIYALWFGLYVQNIEMIDLLPLIWDEDTQIIFGSCLGFWFGSRAMTRRAMLGKT